MKKITLALVFAVVATVGSAQTLKDFYYPSSVPVNFLGIDFSHLHLAEDIAFYQSSSVFKAEDFRDNMYYSWNTLFITESDKYNASKFFKIPEIKVDVKMMEAHNRKAKIDDLVKPTAELLVYTSEDIAKFVKEYKTGDLSGIGVVLIAERFDKTGVEAFYHFVIFNIDKKEVLFTERLRGEPGGFGLRNYWAASFYNVLKAIETKHYKKWKAAVN